VLEFALMVPPLILVLTGAASFSLAFYNLQQLQNAVGATVPMVAAQQGMASDPCASALSDLEAALPTFNTSNLSYSLTVTASGGTTTYTGSGTSFTCQAAGPGTAASPNTTTEMEAGTPVVLKVSYTYTWLVIVPSKDFSPSTPLTASSAALAD